MTGLVYDKRKYMILIQTKIRSECFSAVYSANSLCNVIAIILRLFWAVQSSQSMFSTQHPLRIRDSPEEQRVNRPQWLYVWINSDAVNWTHHSLSLPSRAFEKGLQLWAVRNKREGHGGGKAHVPASHFYHSCFSISHTKVCPSSSPQFGRS